METYVRDANTIWSDFSHKIKNNSAFKKLSSDEQLEFYQKNHKNFAMTFPIVLRYMIQLKRYNQKAFVRFVKKLTSCPYRSELEYCERQADYIKYLFMETSPSHNMKDAQLIWQNAYDMLAKEVEVFKEAQETVKKKMEEDKIKNNAEKRNELKKVLGLQ